MTDKNRNMVYETKSMKSYKDILNIFYIDKKIIWKIICDYVDADIINPVIENILQKYDFFNTDNKFYNLCNQSYALTIVERHLPNIDKIGRHFLTMNEDAYDLLKRNPDIIGINYQLFNNTVQDYYYRHMLHDIKITNSALQTYSKYFQDVNIHEYLTDDDYFGLCSVLETEQLFSLLESPSHYNWNGLSKNHNIIDWLLRYPDKLVPKYLALNMNFWDNYARQSIKSLF